MKVLVTGGTGQLGNDVVKELKNHGAEVYSPSHLEMDIENTESVNSLFFRVLPDIVIHCAAWTNVDLAEDKVDECRMVNVYGTKNILECCRSADIPIVYISTDYVFDGTGVAPWDTDDRTNPQNSYGLSKRDGENVVLTHSKCFIIRISWVFGINGKNFVKSMINLSKTKTEISVVCDQIGSPTYTVDVAKLIYSMILTDKYGIYHACNSGYCSWADLSEKIFELIGADVKVKRVRSDQWPSKVKRPKNSRLDTSSLTKNGFDLLPAWEDALIRFIDEYKTTMQ